MNFAPKKKSNAKKPTESDTSQERLEQLKKNLLKRVQSDIQNLSINMQTLIMCGFDLQKEGDILYDIMAQIESLEGAE